VDLDLKLPKWEVGDPELEMTDLIFGTFPNVFELFGMKAAKKNTPCLLNMDYKPQSM